MIVAENLFSIPKHFADDTSLFSVVRNLNISANEINDNLNEAWAHQWKMSFNTDPLKQEQEVIFSRKRNKPHHPDIIFNSNPYNKAFIKSIWECFLIINLTFMNVLRVFDTLVNHLLVLFANFEIFYRDHFFDYTYFFFIRN